MTARGTDDRANTADREIVSERLIKAPRELVFAAWIDPHEIVKWWGPNGFTTTIHEMDVRPGGVWRSVMHGPDGVDYPNKVVFLEVVAPERIVYDHVSGPRFRSTVTFADEGGKTRLKLHMVFDTAAERDHTAKKFGAVEGAHQTLGRLAELLETTDRQAQGDAKMRKLILFMHVSLDGFAAGPQGEMDWIGVTEEMFDYAERRTREADLALYGRVTYQMMEAYWPTAADQPGATKHDIEHSRWYKKVSKVVLSRTLKEAPPLTRIVSDDAAGEIRRLKQEAGKDILIFGSPGAAHSLMAENLIDDYWLFVNPVLLGQGTPVFKEIRGKAALRLVDSKVFSPPGVVCLHYERKPDA